MYKVFINEKPVVISDTHIGEILPGQIVIHAEPKRKTLLKTIEEFIHDQKSNELVFVNTKEIDLLLKTFLSLFTPVEAAGGIVYHERKGMLWILRNNRWDLPKGKIDKDETIEETAIREVEEETGLKKVSIIQSLGSTHHAYHENDEFILKTSHWFSMRTQDPDTTLVPQHKEGITRVEWVDKQGVSERIDNTFKSLQELARNFVQKYTDWDLR